MSENSPPTLRQNHVMGTSTSAGRSGGCMRITPSVVVLVAGVVAFAAPARAAACRTPTVSPASTVADIQAFFKKQQKAVVTFMGYSGAEYEDKAGMLKRAGSILDALDPKKTIVNIGG